MDEHWSDPAYEPFWIAWEDQCYCGECIRLKDAEHRLNDPYIFNDDFDEADDAIRAAQASLRDARVRLHRLHQPEFYTRKVERAIARRGCVAFECDDPDFYHPQSDCQRNADYAADDGDVEERSDTNRSEIDYEDSEGGYDGRYHGKFIVCDHCRGHALPCNEAPICDQCQMSNTPCVHRLCEDSPNEKEACNNAECRYVHLDYLPTPDESFHISEYIILHGTLRGYMVDRVPRWEWDDCIILDMEQWDYTARERQRGARDNFHRWVAEGYGALHTLHHPCGEQCGKTPGHHPASSESNDCWNG